MAPDLRCRTGNSAPSITSRHQSERRLGAVYLDGVLQGTVSYSGAAGSMRAPVFGSSTRYGALRAGNQEQTPKREREEEGTARPERVRRLGDEAFWLPSRASGVLFVLRKNA